MLWCWIFGMIFMVFCCFFMLCVIWLRVCWCWCSGWLNCFRLLVCWFRLIFSDCLIMVFGCCWVWCICRWIFWCFSCFCWVVLVWFCRVVLVRFCVNCVGKVCCWLVLVVLFIIWVNWIGMLDWKLLCFGCGSFVIGWWKSFRLMMRLCFMIIVGRCFGWCVIILVMSICCCCFLFVVWVVVGCVLSIVVLFWVCWGWIFIVLIDRVFCGIGGEYWFFIVSWVDLVGS